MSNTCPKCGSGSIGYQGLLYYCGNKSTGVYETGKCIKIQRDQLVEQNIRLTERIKRLEDVLEKAELAVAFANREHGVIRMMADDYTEVLQQIRVALKAKEAKP